MGCVIGHEPQDLGYKGESRRLEIGNGNVFREHVTIHRASKADTVTRIGDQCFLMVNSHVGHDCQVGSRVIIANNSMLAGPRGACTTAPTSPAAAPSTSLRASAAT